MTTFPGFAAFFEEVWGYPPYRWQSRLAEQVLADRKWPDGLDLPTGAGKTTAVDIALYCLARSAHEGRLGDFPRRIVVVVDRRVLVDQAWRHGEELLQRIAAAPTLSPVRHALARLCSDPPSSIRLRGACPTDPRWCRSADQVQIVASTVDQVGSRLLLRAYGASPSMRPVEAGLVGQDTLLLLDEAHLSGPLLDTLGHLEGLQPVRLLRPRSHVVALSATPGTAAQGHWFKLDTEKGDRPDERLDERLDGQKVVRWSEERLDRLLKSQEGACILLVANTVDTALTWMGVAARDKTRATFLVTGRMRPIDRGAVLDAVERRLQERKPTIVVATQCIEAGVDWDFDAMISECAAWDALVQRMGRVNRSGTRTGASCVVVPARRTGKAPKSCPVYGQHELLTAAWLSDLGTMVCTPGDMPTPPGGCVRKPGSAPLLIPEYLDLWSQTRASGPAYDISVFLHGVQEERTAAVVWRDIDLERDGPILRTLLKALPPSSLEAVNVPIYKLRDWLDGRRVIDVGGGIEVVPGESVGPGATIVVPSSYGGLGGHRTFDGSNAPVQDRSAEALREQRRLQFEIHDAPLLDEEVSLEDQVAAWIEQDAARVHLEDWSWLDLGERWLFVSSLPLDDEDDGGTFRRRPVDLERHLNGVAERVRATADRLALPEELASDLALAARLHDLGKLDDRFQRLCGRRPGGPPLGKSGMSWAERARRWAVSDYPSGERHEALSAELIRRHGLAQHAHDPELVEHLVASHHGWARPFIRAAQGTARVEDELLGVKFGSREVVHGGSERAPARFRRVQERYGWHGLAWLEAILRLSDHRQSEAEERNELGPSGGPALAAGTVRSSQRPPLERRLHTLNGVVAFDYFAALGLLHALDLAGQRARLRWEAVHPVLESDLALDGLVSQVVKVREGLRLSWPDALNKLDEAACTELLAKSVGPFRAFVTAMLSPGGRSEMDFVSGGRGGFVLVCRWATEKTGKGFRDSDLRDVLRGPRQLLNDKNGKSFRWSPLAALGAARHCTATNDGRTEPWLEWLALMGVAGLVCVPRSTRSGELRSRSTAILGWRSDSLELRWPLWKVPLSWADAAFALAASPGSLADARWCRAPRLVFGTKTNRQYALGPGRFATRKSGAAT